MKKLLLVILLGTALLLSGCDNNKGPFEIRRENGVVVLYSNNKPAKGIVQKKVKNNNNEIVIVSEIFFDKGIAVKEFKLYNLNGEMIVEGNGLWEENNFTGTVKEKGNTFVGNGIFNINRDFLIAYQGKESLDNFVEKTLRNGKYTQYYKDGTIHAKLNLQNGKVNGRCIIYYENGNTMTINNFKDGKLDGEWLYYYENGDLRYSSNYKDGKEIK